MGDRTSYAPGTHSWAELVTSDAAAAKDFYTQLFGWSYNDQPIGDEQVYSMAEIGGSAVAALFASSEQPPHWNCYVTVASADETAARVADLGGSVIAEPFDVFTSGRMAVLSDPTGGILSVWQAGDHIGAYRVNEPGAMTWTDLVTPNAAQATAFYGALFGWTFDDVGDGYRVIKNGERPNGGLVEREGPAAWMPYFGHADVDAVVASIEERGGQLYGGPMEMLQGKLAIVSDPQGAFFAVWTGGYDD